MEPRPSRFAAVARGRARALKLAGAGAGASAAAAFVARDGASAWIALGFLAWAGLFAFAVPAALRQRRRLAAELRGLDRQAAAGRRPASRDWQSLGPSGDDRLSGRPRVPRGPPWGSG
jgi:hypothetical protein